MKTCLAVQKKNKTGLLPDSVMRRQQRYGIKEKLHIQNASHNEEKEILLFHFVNESQGRGEAGEMGRKKDEMED